MRYVTISGNTGAGKSTLLKALRAAVAPEFPGVVAVDEGQLHHPLLQRMFDTPEQWGLIMQYHFIVERAASILSNAEDGCPLLLMERSLSEDPIFFQRLVRLGFIEEAQVDPYARFHAAVSASCPTPDAVIYLRTDPAACVERLNAAMALGDRPFELTGDALVAYVDYLHDAYERWHAEIVERTMVLEIVPGLDVTDEVRRCVEVVAAVGR